LRHQLAAVAVAVFLPALAGADAGARGKAGACAAFVRRVQQEDVEGVSRPDLYDGVSGWIARRAGLDPSEVDGLAIAATPDALACDEFALPAGALRALERAESLPPDRLTASIATCLATLRVLDDTADGPRQAALRAFDAEQARAVAKLLGLLARGVKPQAGAVDARVEELRGAADPRTVALGAGLSACEPLGVEVARVRQAHGAR
jgi:hypothetical protein